MSEREETREEDGGRRHVIYLVGLLFLGLVTYSLAATVGLNLAMKHQGKEEAGSSKTSDSSEPPGALRPATEPDNVD